MSDAISAMGGATWTDGIADLREIGPQGMITLRGELGSAPVKKAVAAVLGVDMPEPGQAQTAKEGAVCWMSPDEVLLLCPYGAVSENLVKVRAALGGAHALAVDVSDARAVFRVSGPFARDVLSKLTPADVSPKAFGPGQFRRSRMAQVAAAFRMVDAETVEIICFRSVAQYMFDLLKAAAQPNSAVGFF